MYQSSFPLSHVYIILHMLGPRASRFRANLISLAWQSSSTLCETENIFANEVCSLNYTPRSFPSRPGPVVTHRRQNLLPGQLCAGSGQNELGAEGACFGGRQTTLNGSPVVRLDPGNGTGRRVGIHELKLQQPRGQLCKPPKASLPAAPERRIRGKGGWRR